MGQCMRLSSICVGGLGRGFMMSLDELVASWCFPRTCVLIQRYQNYTYIWWPRVRLPLLLPLLPLLVIARAGRLIASQRRRRAGRQTHFIYYHLLTPPIFCMNAHALKIKNSSCIAPPLACFLARSPYEMFVTIHFIHT
jgi:hypothetical protein